MQDVSNHLRNLGRSIENQDIDVRLTYTELVLITTLVQNPHSDYELATGVLEECKTLAKDAKSILDRLDR